MKENKLFEGATPYRGRGRVLRVKEGYNPNSSSLGSVVFSIHMGVLAVPVFLASAAAWIASHLTVIEQPPAEAARQPEEKA